MVMIYKEAEYRGMRYQVLHDGYGTGLHWRVWGGERAGWFDNGSGAFYGDGDGHHPDSSLERAIADAELAVRRWLDKCFGKEPTP
jgi:hypothetical protein